MAQASKPLPRSVAVLNALHHVGDQFTTRDLAKALRTYNADAYQRIEDQADSQGTITLRLIAQVLSGLAKKDPPRVTLVEIHKGGHSVWSRKPYDGTEGSAKATAQVVSENGLKPGESRVFTFVGAMRDGTFLWRDDETGQLGELLFE